MQIPVEDEVISEEDSGDPEYQDSYARSHPEVSIHQDAEARAHPEVTEDLDSYRSYSTEVTEDHEFPVAGAIDDENTHNTPEYVETMNLDVKNIDKMIRIY